MSLQLNLEKSSKSLVLSLEKAGIHTPPTLEVGFAMDVSGSFDDEHREGVTDRLLTRLVPWGLTFDPDKKLDVFSFSHGPTHVEEVGVVNGANYSGFVQSRIIDKVAGYNGGTDYSHVIERMLKHYGWTDHVKKAGFFGGLLGRKDQVVVGTKTRSLVIVATDGDNNDKERTVKILRESEARKDEVYFLFLGISNQGSKFPFLESIGDKFGNTGFVAIKNLHTFVAQTDEELNARLIDKELLAWLKASSTPSMG